MRYASETTVSSERSQAEIKSTLQRYGASKYAFFEEDSRSAIIFELSERRLKFELPLPSRTDDEYVYKKRNGEFTRNAYPVDQQHKRWEQACRQRWRALNLAIKAKLEAVESGITSFEEEFLSHILMPNGQTIGEHLVPQVAQICAPGAMPPLLPAIGQTGKGKHAG